MPNSRPRSKLLVLVAASVLLAACGGPAAASPPTVSPQRATATAYAYAETEETFAEVPRVSLEEAKAAYFDKSAVFVDVRASEAYNYEHIPGAINIYYGYMEQNLGELDPQQWIITYCA